MTKREIAEQYNFYVRKRNEYQSKIEKNARIKEKIYLSMHDCNDSMKKIAKNCNLADIFGDLYSRNYNKYCIAEIDAINDIFEEINFHLESVKEDCQESINYWDNKLDNYEEE